MVEKLRRMNESLPGMMLGIFLFGVVTEIIGAFFVNDIVNYSLSLWIGIALAEFMAYHMAWGLDTAMNLGQNEAQKKITLLNLIRYGVVVFVLFLILVTDCANPLYVMLGILGLKVGAYVQPFTHKFLEKISRSASI